MSPAADLVLLGGTIEPMVPRGDGPADALAVAGGRVAAVGRAEDVRASIGPRTEVIQLAGETVLPGFGDAHVHPISGGMLADRCDLRQAAGVEGYLRTIRAYADAHPDRPWIVGSGWTLAAFPNGEPGRELLDRATGARPAILRSDDGHVAWVNSRALEIAGIVAATPDPPHGRIARATDGAPAGTLHDAAALLVARQVPPDSDDDRMRGLLAAQQYLHSLGVTAWQDAHVDPPALAAYRQVAIEGKLTARIEAALWWERSEGLEQIAWFEEARESVAGGDRLRAGSVKIMLDGIIESRTACLTAPYEGTRDRGAPFVEPDLLARAVTELDRRGFSCHFHAVGDGAVRLALDAVEAARRANGIGSARHHVAHIEVVHPDDVPRFARLSVTANMQPLWAADDEQMQTLRLPLLGEERRAWQYPFASLRRAGARLAGGSDWPVSSPDPLRQIEVAVTRVAPETREAAPFYPGERLTLDDALAAFTLGSAFVSHLDGVTGSLAVGNAADLVILDRDLRASGVGPIGDTRVSAAFVAGRRVA